MITSLSTLTTTLLGLLLLIGCTFGHHDMYGTTTKTATAAVNHIITSRRRQHAPRQIIGSNMMNTGRYTLATASAGSTTTLKLARTTAFLMGGSNKHSYQKRHHPSNPKKWAGYSSSSYVVGLHLSPCFATRQTIVPHATTTITQRNHPCDRSRANHPTRLLMASYSSETEELLEEDPTTKVLLQSLEDSLCQTVLPRLSFNRHEIETTQQSAVFVVAVSGGCDSMALLHAMVKLLQQRTPTSKGANDDDDDDDDDDDGVESLFQLSCSGRSVPCELHVVHFDHEQRGLESDGDRLLVEKTCQEYGIPFDCHYWRNHDAALPMSTGNASPKFSQDLARTWRQHHLIQLLNKLTTTTPGTTATLESNEVKAGVILTAHHADDHYETMLIKLLRGTHITHLSGMDMVTVHQGCLFAKPLLKIPKGILEEFLSLKSFAWRTDASNASNKYLRNRVRNELLPLMSDIAGGSDNLQRRLDTLEEQSGKVKEFLQASSVGQKEMGVQFPISATKSFDIVLEEALHSWASVNGYYLPYDQLKRICQQMSDYPQQRQWTLHVGGGWNVVRTGDILELHSSDDDENHRDVPVLPRLKIVGRYQRSLREDTDDYPNTIENGTELLINVGSAEDEAHNFSVQRVEDHPPGAPFLFLPPWRKGRSPIKVKEFLRGQKVPLHLRDHAPMICLNHEHIVAVFVPSNSSTSSNETLTKNGKWIVHADFEPPSITKNDLDVDKQDDIIIRLQLLTP